MTTAALLALALWLSQATGWPMPLIPPAVAVMPADELEYWTATLNDGEGSRHGAYIFRGEGLMLLACGAEPHVVVHEWVRHYQHHLQMHPGDPVARKEQAISLHKRWMREHPTPPAELAKITRCDDG